MRVSYAGNTVLKIQLLAIRATYTTNNTIPTILAKYRYLLQYGIFDNQFHTDPQI